MVEVGNMFSSSKLARQPIPTTGEQTYNLSGPATKAVNALDYMVTETETSAAKNASSWDLSTTNMVLIGAVALAAWFFMRG
jgi:hypothetical protein